MFAIVDIETTGNGIKGNKITEIAIFKFDGQQVVEEFTSLVNPLCPIPNFITGLTGIDNQMVDQAPTFEEIADNILEITKDTIFVAHSVNFDYGVIKEEFRRLGKHFVRKKLCTVRLSRKLIPGLRSYSLGKLCTAVQIPITDRHRARGDAKATVSLFKRLLETPGAPTIVKHFLNARSQEATLPPHLDQTVLQRIPHQPGIYFFHNQKGNVIYVGKAKNLRKRVLGHFYDKSEHEILLCREVADITFELSGDELIALLMEAAAIKEYWPRFNRAQKRTTKQFGVFYYEDRSGILHLGFGPARNLSNPLTTFSSLTASRNFVNQLCTEFMLCPKYCQLRSSTNSCSSGLPSGCEGVCQGAEDRIHYNAKVEKAIAFLQTAKEDRIIEQNGRHAGEKGFVLIRRGCYQGYGFIGAEHSVNTFEDLEAFLIPQKNTLETQQIIKAYHNNTSLNTTRSMHF
ncbi:MAG: exonuclease domain-containing protein [Bacteroidota bacterium]